MSIYLFYILITIVIIILFFLVENKIDLLNKIAIVGIISSISLIVIGFILKFLFNVFLSNFNITKISSLIFNKFLNISVYFLGISVLLLIIFKIIKRKNKKVLKNNNF